MKHCPCGSQLNYSFCCELYIENKHIPPSPEALMRSRYTAYTLSNISYIKKTMKGKPLINFNDAEALEWAKNTSWIDLNIISTKQGDLSKIFVEFVARFIQVDILRSLHEISEFRFYDGMWFYTDGVLDQKQINKKIGRNIPCPCGSMRKFKNCHEKK